MTYADDPIEGVVKCQKGSCVSSDDNDEADTVNGTRRRISRKTKAPGGGGGGGFSTKKKTVTAITTTNMTSSQPTWASLPPEALWMRHFIESDDDDASEASRTRLARIPSMDNQDYWPDEVRRPCVEILLHAQVYHAALCPTRLLSDGTLCTHHNTSMLFCVRDSAAGGLRMFVRCFSESCKAYAKQQHEPRHERFLARGWVEVIQDDLTVARIKQRRPLLLYPPGADSLSLPSPSALSTASTATATTTTLDPEIEELVDMLMADDAPSPPLPLWYKGLPGSVSRWMRGLLALPDSTTETYLSHFPKKNNASPLPADLPSPLQTLFRLGRASIILHATAPYGLAFCPRLLARTGVRTPHADVPHSPTVLGIRHVDPRCAGTSYRLFVLCIHPDCVHLRSPEWGPWIELSREHAVRAPSRA